MAVVTLRLCRVSKTDPRHVGGRTACPAESLCSLPCRHFSWVPTHEEDEKSRGSQWTPSSLQLEPRLSQTDLAWEE